MKKIKNLLEFYFLNTIIFIFNNLSIKTAYKNAKNIGLFVYYIIPIRHNTAYSNIKIAFPHKNKKEIKSIVKKTYINFAYFIIESIIMQKIRKSLATSTQIYGLELLKKASSEKNGVVLYTAHIGNWHIMGQTLVDKGFCINNVVKKQRNPYVFQKEIDAMIESGMKITILQKTPKNIFYALKNNDIVEFLADQDAGENGIFINFFNKIASTATGPALFSLKMDSPIIFAIDIRDENNPEKHNIFIEKINYEKTDDINKDIYNLTEILTKKLEKYIIANPSQYFWLHKRWRTQPRNLGGDIEN